jgi:hypothetical protein
MLHETPTRFGEKHSQTIMGYQMAVAHTGSTFLPPFLGFIASHSTIGIFPFSIVVFIAAMLLGSERLNILPRKKIRERGKTQIQQHFNHVSILYGELVPPLFPSLKPILFSVPLFFPFY